MKIKLIGKTLVCEHLKEDEMHLEKGDKYMVMYKANIVDTDGERYLVLKISEEGLSIPITEDRPKDIQDVFNKLIVLLKKGLFQFELEENAEQDIIYHIGKEYISQLNAELQNVFEEMKGYELIEAENPE